jgi:Zn-dependent protease
VLGLQRVLRFRLGSIEVVVHPAHLLFALALGLSAGRPGDVSTAEVVGVWVVLVFLSVLFHELGHAVAFRAFGYRSTVQLVLFGGITTPETDQPLTWGKDVVCTLSGPAVGVALGLLCLVLHPRASSALIEYTLEVGTWTNLVWAGFNLLPILPMDGGRVSRAVLGRIFGRSGVAGAYALGVLFCGGVAYLLFRTGWGGPVTLVFLLLFAAQNFQGLMAAWRTAPDAPAPPQLIEAETLFRSGEWARARALASVLLDGELAAATRSRIHHLLGWIALKEGEGRRALDEFSQVQGRPIEPQALAAAFSLIGDDTRAIPLWEQAARQSADPTILHEWAGALLRHGDVRAAAAVPGVDLATAYERAERVAFLRGAYSEAARFGEESLARRPSAARAYDVACDYARAGDLRRAMALLVRARDLGYSDREAAMGDPDLVPLAGEPAFQEWLSSLQKSAAS